MKKNPTKDNKEKLQFSEWNLPQFDCHISVWFRSTRKFKGPKTPEEIAKVAILRYVKSFEDELLSLTNLDIIGGIPFRGKEPFEFVDNITSFNIVSVSLSEYR
jgi:hypothetical protein